MHARAKPDPKWPSAIPKSPDQVYEKEGWISWKDFLGTTRFTYEQARAWARELRLAKKEDWELLTKTHPNWPKAVPKSPRDLYETSDWISWKDFLGTSWVTYEEAREWGRKQGIKTSLEWAARAKDPSWPGNMPKNPNSMFKNTG